MRTHTPIATVAILSCLAACSSGGGDSAATAPLSVRLTDAPADAALIANVCLAFSRITLHYAGGNEVRIDYDPLPAQVRPETHCMPAGTTWDGVSAVPPVRLSALGGSLTVALVQSLAVPVGRITWIRLHLIPGESYLDENAGGRYSMSDESLLRCPSCETTDNNDGRGFKLNRTLEVPAGGLAVTIDLDLGVSLHKNGNGYVLRPTARVELDDTLGTIAGDVDVGVIGDLGGTPSNGMDLDTDCAAYVFDEKGTTPDDFYATSPVVTTARVRLVDFGLPTERHAYAAGALPEGPYTVALTCGDDTEADEDLTFSTPQDADVIAGQTTIVDF